MTELRRFRAVGTSIARPQTFLSAPVRQLRIGLRPPSAHLRRPAAPACRNRLRRRARKPAPTSCAYPRAFPQNTSAKKYFSKIAKKCLHFTLGCVIIAERGLLKPILRNPAQPGRGAIPEGASAPAERKQYNKPTGAMKREVAVPETGYFRGAPAEGTPPTPTSVQIGRPCPVTYSEIRKYALCSGDCGNCGSAGYLTGRDETLGGVSEIDSPPGQNYFRQEEKQWQRKKKSGSDSRRTIIS